MKTLLLILGAPLWTPLLIAAAAIVLSLFAALCSVIISFWTVFASIAISAPAIITVGFIHIISVNTMSGFSFIACGMILAGIAIFAFYGCLYATKGFIGLLKIKRYRF